ncbi:MAG: gamma-glutamyl-phosphate reductase, partial [Bacillota bacterium]|nr:gamma-glutamyl-phosphate reductase [Bacillota bacterium]
MEQYIIELAKRAKEAAPVMALQTTGKKNTALQTMANALRAQKKEILAANAKDMEAGRDKGLTKALLDRLLLTHERIESMAQGLEALIQLTDPIGDTIAMWRQPNGLEIGRKRVPLGVIAIIYEARPNVPV